MRHDSDVVLVTKVLVMRCLEYKCEVSILVVKKMSSEFQVFFSTVVINIAIRVIKANDYFIVYHVFVVYRVASTA